MTEFKGDKRTKAYKEWKAKHEKESKGLGDTVEKITTATGIKKAVKFLAGEDCGCDERKEKLNQLFSYKKPECLTEEEYIYLDELFQTKTNTITPDVQKRLLEINNRVFHENRSTTSCGPCFMNNVFTNLRLLFEQYN